MILPKNDLIDKEHLLLYITNSEFMMRSGNPSTMKRKLFILNFSVGASDHYVVLFLVRFAPDTMDKEIPVLLDLAELVQHFYNKIVVESPIPADLGQELHILF